MRAYPSLEVQRTQFESLQLQNENELRACGIDRFLEVQGIDTRVGRLIVSRHFAYSSERATIDHDLDPSAIRLATEHEIGIVIGDSRFGSRHFWLYGEALHGEEIKPAGIGLEMSRQQFEIAEAAVKRLLKAKYTDLALLSLTKSLTKIDPAGD